MRSPLFPIFLTVFVDVLGVTLMIPLLPFYAEHFGASPLVVGTLSASFAICQLISGPVLGRISDRVGRKPTLLVSQVGTLIGFLTIGFADSLWMLFLGRIIDGLTAGNLSIAQAYISDVTKPEERTKAFGFIGIAFGAGFLVGPAISGFLAHRFGYASPAFGAAGLSLTSVIVTALLLPKAEPSGGDQPSRWQHLTSLYHRPGPRRRLAEFFFFTLAFSTLIGGLALFLERRFSYDVEKTGYVYALSGFIGGMIQGGALGRLVKRLGEERLALIGFLAMATGYSFLGLAHTLAILLVVIVIASFGAAVTRPSLTTMLTKSVGREEQGSTLGVSQSLASVSQIVGPLTAGWLIEHHMLTAYGLTAGAIAAMGAVLRFMREPAA
jgi:MFS transporter, DHA1 family, tetracycline resistance protein